MTEPSIGANNDVFAKIIPQKFDEENFRFRRRKPSERSDGVDTYSERLESTDF